MNQSAARRAQGAAGPPSVTWPASGEPEGLVRVLQPQ